jgi:hypothetical protein
MELPAPTVGIAKIKREFRKAENQEETRKKGIEGAAEPSSHNREKRQTKQDSAKV